MANGGSTGHIKGSVSLDPREGDTTLPEASELFDEVLAWLADNHAHFRFFVERDVVWTVQRRLHELVQERELPYKVYNDFPLLRGKRRGLSADLVILGDGLVEVAVEFKYEPSHSRDDILPTKFPVVFWGDEGVGKDVKRVRQFVDEGKTRVAYALLIDEGGYFRKRSPHPGSVWVEWPNGVWVLYTRLSAGGTSARPSAGCD